MISCPNCGKSVADDAVHCGHCGHKIEMATNQKTMMGFSLSPEDLQKAIAEAGQLRASQSAAAEAELVDEMGRTEILPAIDANPALSDTLDPDSDFSMETEQMSGGSPFESDSGFRRMEPKNDVLDGLAATPSVHDPFAQPSVAPFGPSTTPMQQSPVQQSPMQVNFQTGDQPTGEQSFVEKNKKLLMIGGAVFAVLFACCILSTIYSFFFAG